MFWDVLKEAGEILLFWRFWAVILCYGALQLVPLLFAGMVMERNTALGWTTWIVSAVVWPVIILTGALLVLAPLMIGKVDKIAWEFLGLYSLQQIAVIGGVAFIATLVIAFVPIIGRFDSIGNFVQVALILGIVTYTLTGGAAVVWPGWLMTAGLAVTGGVVTYVLAMMLIGIIFLGVGGEKREGLATVIARPVGALVSMVPACLYAGWLRVANGWV